MTSDYIERRKDNLSNIEEIKTDLALIRQKSEFIDEKMDHINSKINSIMQGQISKSSFIDHVIADRWMFGILVTLVVGVIIKLFN